MQLQEVNFHARILRFNFYLQVPGYTETHFDIDAWAVRKMLIHICRLRKRSKTQRDRKVHHLCNYATDACCEIISLFFMIVYPLYSSNELSTATPTLPMVTLYPRCPGECDSSPGEGVGG